MDIKDLKLLLDHLSPQPESSVMQRNPIEELTFNEEYSLKFLNSEERVLYDQLEEEYATLRQQISLTIDKNEEVGSLHSQYEDVMSNLNALSMIAIFREGMLKGFRMAQFFLKET